MGEKKSKTPIKLLIFILSLVIITILGKLTSDHTITMPAVYPFGYIGLGFWASCEIAEKIWGKGK